MIEHTSAVRDLLSSTWKVDLLYILARGVQRYSRLYDNLKGASKKMLTGSLRGLERDSCGAPTMPKFRSASSTHSPRSSVGHRAPSNAGRMGRRASLRRGASSTALLPGDGRELGRVGCGRRA